MTKYLFRVDDVAEEMDWDRFEPLCEVFKKYKVKPIIAIIPDNKDLSIKGTKKENWVEYLNEFTIAQHGYNHIMIGDGGIRKLNLRGEISGLPIEHQFDMISSGYFLLKNKGFEVKTYVAPWHAYDENTLKVLRSLKFKYISDGSGIYPYKHHELIFVPVNDWKISKKYNGLRTLTMHAQDITPKKVKAIEYFISQNITNIISIDDVQIVHDKNEFKNVFYMLYFWIRHSRDSPFFSVINLIKTKHL